MFLQKNIEFVPIFRIKEKHEKTCKYNIQLITIHFGSDSTREAIDITFILITIKSGLCKAQKKSTIFLTNNSKEDNETKVQQIIQ